MGSEVEKNVGFGRSDGKTYTVLSGTGQSEQIDLERPFAFIVVYCDDATNIAANTTMTMQVSPEHGINLCDVYEQNDPNTQWSKAIPASGTFCFLLTHAFGARFVKPILNTATDGDVTFTIFGYDPTVVNQPDR